MSTDKYIFVLIGQKGSGKSLTGSIINDLYGITFVRVEDIAIKIKKDRSITDDSYLNDVFTEIENHLREILSVNSRIVFESTGLSKQFDTMLGNLKNDFHVFSIYLESDPGLCIERVKSRDQSLHINISDDDLLYINSLVRKNSFKCDYVINNNGSREELTDSVRKIFRQFSFI